MHSPVQCPDAQSPVQGPDVQSPVQCPDAQSPVQDLYSVTCCGKYIA